MHLLSRIIALSAGLALGLSTLLFPCSASADSAKECRLFVYYDTYGTPLFQKYAEFAFDSFGCDDKSILGSDERDRFFEAMTNTFSLSGSEDVNVIILQTHGLRNGAICLHSDLRDLVRCSPESFRGYCDSLPGRTVIITVQCYGGQFAQRFWSAGYGPEYAESHYAVYAVSGTTVGYIGESAVLTIPFGKVEWSDYLDSYAKFGSDGYRLLPAPLDENSDGFVSVRELYDYSAPLQFRFARFASCNQASSGEGESDYSYPTLYGSECLDLPLFPAP